jgi:formylglycine-generating enzyme required for sulfatase activity/uncharacterized caspase-like protein
MRGLSRILGAVLVALAVLAADIAVAQTSRAKRSVTAGPEKRVALVVGNSRYKFIPALDNPKNDAKLIAQTLQGLGFKLIGGGAQLDLDKADFDRAVMDFGQILAQGADVALFFYAGHGLQVRGSNYLVPVSANPQREADVDFQMMDANLVLRQMEGAGTKLNVLILDACRNNPFGGRGLRAAGGGLAQMQAPEGTLISYATQPGNVAMDGQDGDSPYTKALAQTLRKPGLDVFQAFNEIGLTVKRTTGGAQQPWVASSPIEGEFYFAGPPSAATVADVPSPAVDAAAMELAFWQSVKDSASPAEVQAYVDRYPSGQFAPIAKARVVALQEDIAWDSVKDSGDPADIQSYLDRYPGGRYVGRARTRLASLKTPLPSPAPAAHQQQAAVLPVHPASPATAGLQPGQTFRDCADCPEMVVIPPGQFMMGTEPAETTREAVPDDFAKRERPLHPVSVRSALSVGKYHVTVGEYARFVQATGYTGAGCQVYTGSKYETDNGKSWRDPGFAQTDRDPVVCVSWDDAKAYVQWLGRTTGKGYRLLTEAEWEYAARAGTATARFWGDDTKSMCSYANAADLSAQEKFQDASTAPCRDGYVYTSPVGSFRPNGFGLYDMLGNAWQWTEDCWTDNYAGAANDSSIALTSGGNCQQHVLRGGSWGNAPLNVRAGFRLRNFSGARAFNNGFRVARTN